MVYIQAGVSRSGMYLCPQVGPSHPNSCLNSHVDHGVFTYEVVSLSLLHFRSHMYLMCDYPRLSTNS